MRWIKTFVRILLFLINISARISCSSRSFRFFQNIYEFFCKNISLCEGMIEWISDFARQAYNWIEAILKKLSGV
jgi:hypothetical protein